MSNEQSVDEKFLSGELRKEVILKRVSIQISDEVKVKMMTTEGNGQLSIIPLSFCPSVNLGQPQVWKKWCAVEYDFLFPAVEMRNLCFPYNVCYVDVLVVLRRAVLSSVLGGRLWSLHDEWAAVSVAGNLDKKM